MEVIRRYPEIEELLFSIDRIANNLDEMIDIMKTSVNVTPEQAKQINALYGMSVARPLPDYDPEFLRQEIQDLKLENDRLKKRDEIMFHFLQSVRCKGLFCDECDLGIDGGCYWVKNHSSSKDMWDMIDAVFKKLEDL